MFRVALALSLLALAAPVQAAAPKANAAKTCSLSVSQQRNSGATYLLQLKVGGITCAAGLKVEKDFQSCRRGTAGHTTCKRRVDHYRCTQKVLDSIKSQYDARVACTNGARSVGFTYTQNK